MKGGQLIKGVIVAAPAAEGGKLGAITWMTMRVSTLRRSSSMPSSAWLVRLRPSKEKGHVTTPMVSAWGNGAGR